MGVQVSLDFYLTFGDVLLHKPKKSANITQKKWKPFLSVTFLDASWYRLDLDCKEDPTTLQADAGVFIQQ